MERQKREICKWSILGRVSYITNGDFTDENISKGAQFYPIAIWFDENF